jgi:uncharacterized protein
MQVTIFGATGKVGKQLITHALARGWKVVAFGRNIDEWIDKDLNNKNFKAVKGYIFDARNVRKALKGSDAVLSALGGAVDGKDKSRSLGMKNIVAQMEKQGPKRIVALGGLGVLDARDGSGPLFEQEDYPKEYVAVGFEHYQAYGFLKESSLDWTFVCSPNIIEQDSDGKMDVVSEAPAPNFEISSGNLGLYMTQAIANESNIKERVGIGNKLSSDE